MLEQDQSHQDDSLEMEVCIDRMFTELNSDALNFQKLYYSERKHLLYLDQQRCSMSND